ncbi:MAG: hypothetical protein CV081_04060 [Nitrospira sp. LK265]|nr:hypothetical protein [Nitrospira sp.]NGZ59665.1 hypothetical protein [Nitrospira sp. LK265]
MLFQTKQFELEISKFLYLRAPWVGAIYIGPDSGRGCIVHYSPNQIELGHLEYIEMTRRNLRTR